MNEKVTFRTLCMWSIILLAGLATGCGYNKSASTFIQPYEAGQYEQAALAAEQVIGPVRDAQNTPPDKLIKADSEDWLIYRLEQGAIYRAAGRLEDSILAFHHADALMAEADKQAELRLSAEVGAAVTNQAFRDYNGYTYDRIALHLYQGLNFLQLGQLDNARIALRAMQQRQEEAEEHFRKKIEELQKESGDTAVKGSSKNSEQSVDMDKTRNDPKLTQSLQSVYGKETPIVPDRSAFKNYTNPFGEYLQGIYFMAAGAGGSDAETAATAFKRVRGMLPNNEYVEQDLKLAESVANGSPILPTTYVLFETGQAPIRDEIRIDIPIFVLNMAWRDTGVDYVGAAFPRLKYRDNYTPYLSVAAGEQTFKTSVLTDMDAVIQKDFNNELPLVITRTIISTATKAAASYGLNKASEGNIYANIITRVATTAYQAGMNQADLRTWNTLPKQFQVARFPTPDNRQIALSLPNGTTCATVTLEPGIVNVVYVKSVQANQVPLVRQFKLK